MTPKLLLDATIAERYHNTAFAMTLDYWVIGITEPVTVRSGGGFLF